MQKLGNLSDNDESLIDLACEHAKTRYNDLTTIAAALRTKNGKIYTGINLKYRVRNVSTCAEIMALQAALNAGETEFESIVGVKYFPETDSYDVVNGCGLCRQMFIYNTPLQVIIDADGVLKRVDAKELLQYAFK